MSRLLKHNIAFIKALNDMHNHKSDNDLIKASNNLCHSFAKCLSFEKTTEKKRELCSIMIDQINTVIFLPYDNDEVKGKVISNIANTLFRKSPNFKLDDYYYKKYEDIICTKATQRGNLTFIEALNDMIEKSQNNHLKI